MFLRLYQLDEKNIFRKISPSLITFMVSAFWHGFYPNYYIFFFFAFILEQISGLIQDKTKFFEKIESYKGTPKVFIFILVSLISQVAVCSQGLFFALTTFDKGYAYIKNLCFIPWIAFILLFIILRKILTKKEGKNKSTHNEKKKD